MNDQSAFPAIEVRHENGTVFVHHTGMTLRDYFAAKAMEGMLADPNSGGSSTVIARCAYEIADAMLAARETKGQ